MADSGYKYSSFCGFLRPHFKAVYPKQCFLLPTQSLRMPRNVCKMHHKVRNGQNLPHEGPNFRNEFYRQLRPFFHKSETTLPKKFFLNDFFYTLNFRMFRNMCIFCHKLCNAIPNQRFTVDKDKTRWF